MLAIIVFLAVAMIIEGWKSFLKLDFLGFDFIFNIKIGKRKKIKL